jgi:hypothetical protein
MRQLRQRRGYSNALSVAGDPQNDRDDRFGHCGDQTDEADAHDAGLNARRPRSEAAN